MCYLCDQYGDPKFGDGIWYLNPKNYARNMYKLRMPGEKFKGPESDPERGTREGPTDEDLVNALEKGDQQELDRVREAIVKAVRGRGMPNQVVPLNDADRILELCSPIGIMRCSCRAGVRARDERNEFEYTCIGMGEGMLKWERWPERYKGGIKLLSVEEAIEWNHLMDKKGFVHILMLFGAPYIGGFWQCDYPDCGAIRHAVDFGYGPLKSHYVAQVDYDICNGCGICAQRCQFGALKFEVTIKKANIDQFRCWGCGLCQTGCPRGAIKLLERKSVPALAGLWEGKGAVLAKGRKFPKITIDQEKCTVPFLCKKCLQACPTVVFDVRRVMAREERLREIDPRVDGNYTLSVRRRDKCIACNKCVEVCPAGALKLEVP